MSEYEEMIQEQEEEMEEEKWNCPSDEEWDQQYSWCCEYWQDLTKDEMINIMRCNHDIDVDDYWDKSFDDVETEYFKLSDDDDNWELVNTVAWKISHDSY